MKKILLMTLAAAAGAVWAEDVEIDALNIVGIQPVTGTSTKSSEMTLPMPFVGIGGGDAKLADAVYAGNLDLGEMVRICLNSTDGYFYNWLATGGQVEGCDFYPSARTESGVDLVPSSADVQTVPLGVGISLTAKALAKTSYVMGQYTADVASTTINGGSYVRTYLANPLSTSFYLEKISGAVGDMITVATSDGTERVYYYDEAGNAKGYHWYYNRSGGWTYNSKLGVAVQKTTRVFANPTIAAGAGFSYERKSSSDLTFSWSN